MKLSTLNLANYRGYDQLDLKFDPELTVIAGVNGVGKSSLLAAIVHCASQILPQVTSSKEEKIGITPTDLKAGKEVLSISSVFKAEGAHLYVDTARKGLISIEEAKALTAERDQLRAKIRDIKTKKGSIEQSDLQEKIQDIDDRLNSNDVETLTRVLSNLSEEGEDSVTVRMKDAQAQPIAVFYSTTRLISRLPPVLGKTKIIDISTAYSKALNQLEVSLHEFANWYRVQQEDKESAEKLFAQLNHAVGVFLERVGNLELHETRPPRFSVEKGDTCFFLEQLSDGERGLLALVFDLTRRLSIANPESDNPLIEGKAIVLIDEIELHLHPKWQRMVVRKLREVFPACQFIVTTHSPMVIGEAHPESIRFLYFDDDNRICCHTPSESYGLDANRILQEHMGAPIRNKNIEDELHQLFLLIDDEDFSAAREKIESLSKSLGENEPEITRANSLIAFLEGDD